MDLPDKANCTSGRHEPHGYQGLPEGSVRKGYQGNRRHKRSAGILPAVPRASSPSASALLSGHGPSTNVLCGRLPVPVYFFENVKMGTLLNQWKKENHDLDPNRVTAWGR